MALLDWMAPDVSDLVVEGEGVRLRPPRMGDFRDWAALRAASRAFLQPWEPRWPADDLTRAAFRRRLSVYAREIDAGHAFPFLVFRHEDGALVGGVTLSNVRRGVAEMGTLGYWVGEPFTRRGYTSAAVRAVLRFAYRDLRLHRVEAACLPENAASRGVLARCGFVEEGRAAAYLKINGEWRDHLLFGRLDEAR
ncbi:MAG TPA: GNAT family protein [Caulobacteraceae bacterium]